MARSPELANTAVTGRGRNFGCDSGSERGFRTTEITEFHGKKVQDKQTPTVRSSPTHSAFPFPFSRRSLSIVVVILILLLIFFLIVIVVVIVICLREAKSSSPLRTTHPSRACVYEQMSESERNGDDHKSGRTPHRRPRLMGRAMRERWAIPGSLRLSLVERLGEIVRAPEAPYRDVLSAVSAILTASKINLANIALTIKVQRHEELEEHVKELERKVGPGKLEYGGLG